MATFTQMRDEMKTCPYNPLHRVSARRLQAHIVKCSRNPANPVMVDCPFNALHKVLPEDLQQHVLLCKDSRQVIREIEESRNRQPINKPVVHRSEIPVSSDDWEEEMDKDDKCYTIPGLVPEEYKDDGTDRPFQILSQIQIQRLKPAERKKYYKELTEKAKSQELPQTKSELRIKEENEMPSTSSRPQSAVEIIDEDHPNNVRNPTTNPFRKMAGVGRGNTPLGNRSGVRQIGSRPSPQAEPTVKRERDDNSFFGAKRFSP